MNRQKKLIEYVLNNEDPEPSRAGMRKTLRRVTYSLADLSPHPLSELFQTKQFLSTKLAKLWARVDDENGRCAQATQRRAGFPAQTSYKILSQLVSDVSDIEANIDYLVKLKAITEESKCD